MEIPEKIRGEYPFDKNAFKKDGFQLNYVDEGEGRAIVMLHGNPTWSFYYRNVIKELKGSFRCLALDNMGCGLSDKPQGYDYILSQHIENAVSWIKELELDSFDLMVHDWGGAIGMGVAKELSSKIGKVIILNTAAFHVPRIPLRISVCRIPFVGDLIVRGLNGFAGPAVTMAVKKPLSKIEKQGYLLPYNNWKNRIANLRFVQDIPTKPTDETFQVLKDIETFLPELANHSILIGWGLKDFCFNNVFLEKWKKIYPDAQVNAFQNSGHYILDDEKETLIPEIRKFLQSNP